MTAALTLAIGGERHLPTPDPVARDYLLLALRLDQRSPGVVDGYFGPADLKAEVDMEQLRSPERLADDARDLRLRLPSELDDPARRAWLDVQLAALEAQARSLAGDALPYLDLVERYFEFRPPRRPDGLFIEIAARLDELLPGEGLLRDRLAALDESVTIAPDQVAAAAEWLVDRFRATAREQFGLPDGESVQVRLVRDQPWSGYNWYDGGRRSRVHLNIDLPVRAPDLISVLAHETFAGHHLEHAWKETDLVLAKGRLEASVLLLNTPECLISEGLADLGHGFAVGPDGEGALLAELADLVSVKAAGRSPAERRGWAERLAEIADLRRRMGEIAVNAALMRHVDGAPRDRVLRYLEDVGLMAPERAEKRLSFIEHPLWRTYVIVYSEGEQLLSRWLDAVPSTERSARFGRLLREQITPGGILAELGEG